jgi:SapC
MTKPVLLNNVEHRDLRVITRRSAQYGDDVMCALTSPAEFRSVQAHYPIFFRKAADSGQFQPFAMFGLSDKENLFLDEKGWDATYIPLTVERQPFLIGFQSGAAGAGAQPTMVVHVDLDSPRISRTEGERLFLEYGGISEHLQRVNAVLGAIHAGIEATPVFIAALLRHELLESFALDVRLADGTDHRVAGFYTINEERLAGLDGVRLEELHRDGHLLPIYMAIASLSNIRALIERKNRRLAR